MIAHQVVEVEHAQFKDDTVGADAEVQQRDKRDKLDVDVLAI